MHDIDRAIEAARRLMNAGRRGVLVEKSRSCARSEFPWPDSTTAT